MTVLYVRERERERDNFVSGVYIYTSTLYLVCVSLSGVHTRSTFMTKDIDLN